MIERPKLEVFIIDTAIISYIPKNVWLKIRLLVVRKLSSLAFRGDIG